MVADEFIPRISLVDRTAERLREEIRNGLRTGDLPGSAKLADEWGVARRTVRAAVARLVETGELEGGGTRGAFRVVATKPAVPKKQRIKVAILLVRSLHDEPREIHLGLLRIAEELEAAGHLYEFVRFPTGKDTHKTGYLPGLLKAVGADAWLLHMPTEEIVRWFAASGVPVLGMGGRSDAAPIATAGLSWAGAIPRLVDQLVAWGHRRIVLVTPHNSRFPRPSPIVENFNTSLERGGICPGPYNVPDWEETPAGLGKLMESLFKLTPPTAIISRPLTATFGILAWLERAGMKIPRDVSFVAMETEPCMKWLFPHLQIAEPTNKDEWFYRRIRRWVMNVAVGKQDIRKDNPSAFFELGNTIGPVPAGKIL